MTQIDSIEILHTKSVSFWRKVNGNPLLKFRIEKKNSDEPSFHSQFSSIETINRLIFDTLWTIFEWKWNRKSLNVRISCSSASKSAAAASADVATVNSVSISPFSNDRNIRKWEILLRHSQCVCSVAVAPCIHAKLHADSGDASVCDNSTHAKRRWSWVDAAGVTHRQRKPRGSLCKCKSDFPNARVWIIQRQRFDVRVNSRFVSMRWKIHHKHSQLVGRLCSCVDDDVDIGFIHALLTFRLKLFIIYLYNHTQRQRERYAKRLSWIEITWKIVSLDFRWLIALYCTCVVFTRTRALAKYLHCILFFNELTHSKRSASYRFSIMMKENLFSVERIQGSENSR